MLEGKEKDGRFDEDGREEAETLVLLDEGSKSKFMFEEPTKEEGMWLKKEELEREKMDPPASKEDGRKLTGGPKKVERVELSLGGGGAEGSDLLFTIISPSLILPPCSGLSQSSHRD